MYQIDARSEWEVNHKSKPRISPCFYNEYNNISYDKNFIVCNYFRILVFDRKFLAKGYTLLVLVSFLLASSFIRVQFVFY